MPYPNEHAVRLVDPKQFDQFRRTNGGTLRIAGKTITVPKSVSIIWGINTKGGTREVRPQALRFKKSSWTAEEAKAWLSKNGIRGRFEAASGD